MPLSVLQNCWSQPSQSKRPVNVSNHNLLFDNSSPFDVPSFWQIGRLERHGFTQTWHTRFELIASLLFNLHVPERSIPHLSSMLWSSFCSIGLFEIQFGLSSNLSGCSFAWFSQLMIALSFCATKMLAKFRILLTNCVPSLNEMPLLASCQDHHRSWHCARIITILQT